MHTLGSLCVYISEILNPEIEQSFSGLFFTVKSQDAVHTLESLCVYISEILKPEH